MITFGFRGIYASRFPIWNELLAVVRLDGRRSVRRRLTSRRSPGNTGASGSQPSCLSNFPAPLPSPLDAGLAGLSHLPRAAVVTALEPRAGLGAGRRLHCSRVSLLRGNFALHQQSISPAASGYSGHHGNRDGGAAGHILAPFTLGSVGT